MSADENRVLCCGENPFIRLSASDDGPETTVASYWRNVLSPAGPGHVLYLMSELTGNEWRIWSDNIAMARWLQETIQRVLNPELADLAIPVEEAVFEMPDGRNAKVTVSIGAAGFDPRFKSVEELTEVKGIGDAMLERLRGHVTLKGKSTAQAQ